MQSVILPTLEYYLAIERNQALICAPTWMNLKNMLSEERHTQKDTSIIQFHLYAVSKVSTPVEMESDCRWIRALFWG